MGSFGFHVDALFPHLGSDRDDLALECGDRSLSWRDLGRACLSQLARLTAAGLRPGQRVAVWTQPSLDTAVALVANAVAGIVTVPLDPKLGQRELGHIAFDSSPVAALAAHPEEVSSRLSIPCWPAASTPGPPPGVLPVSPAGNQPLVILYTSGTTGPPKGAVLSGRAVAANLDALATAWEWTHLDTVVHSLPLFHVHGLVLGLFGPVRRGGALRWLPRFEPVELARALLRGRTLLFAVPTMYHRLADAAEQESLVAEGLRAARLLISGSAPLPIREHRRLEALSGRRVLERYGLTETLINCAMTASGPAAPGYVGPALPGVEVRLVDEARQPLLSRDDTTIGEVAVRGDNVFEGYLNRPEATAAVLSGGWFYTGDLACQRGDGFIRIVGRRATDLIKCGGYKVGAGEVEAALLEHPAVREAAVVGQPDPDLGEHIVAYVVASAAVQPEELIAHVASVLSPHKRPRQVHLVPALPRNAMGKVMKAALREPGSKEL